MACTAREMTPSDPKWPIPDLIWNVKIECVAIKTAGRPWINDCINRFIEIEQPKKNALTCHLTTLAQTKHTMQRMMQQVIVQIKLGPARPVWKEQPTHMQNSSQITGGYFDTNMSGSFLPQNGEPWHTRQWCHKSGSVPGSPAGMPQPGGVKLHTT